MIDFSIVLPCFNEEKNLKKILSLGEKFLNDQLMTEVIIVDNGSIDKTERIIRKYKKKKTKIKFIKIKNNIGYGNGILTGLKYARGKYIGWSHGDDEDTFNRFKKAIKLSNNKQNIFIKGYRSSGRRILDLIFSYSLNVFSSLILRVGLWEITAQPTFFSYNLLKKFKNPPLDFSLDLYAYFIAKKNNFRVLRIKYTYLHRKIGKSSWNINFFSRINLSLNYLSYLIKLKND